MTVRDINRHLLTWKHVVAIYLLDGQEQQGRITCARTRQGIVEVKSLNSGRWVPLKSAQSVWLA